MADTELSLRRAQATKQSVFARLLPFAGDDGDSSVEGCRHTKSFMLKDPERERGGRYEFFGKRESHGLLVGDPRD